MKERKKKIAQSCFVFIICFSFMLNPYNVYAVGTVDSENIKTRNENIANDEMPVEDNVLGKEQVGKKEENIVLSTSFQKYFQERGENYDFLSVKKIVVSTTYGYYLSLDDLRFVKQKFNSLETLDVKSAVFDSEESYNWGLEEWGEKELFTYLYTEHSFREDDIQEGESNERQKGTLDVEQSIENPNFEGGNSPLNEEKVVLNTELKGLCVADKGRKLELGIVYESTDPNIEFQWLQYDLSNGQWSYLSWMSKGNWITWEPKKPGNYWICVQAKTSDGNITSSTYAYTWRGIVTNLTGIYMIDKGTKYDMGICYNSNDSDIKFQWKLYNLKKQQWILHQYQSDSNWTSWMPKEEGTYWIHVEAIDSMGGMTTYTMPFYFGGLKTQLNGIGIIERRDYIDMGVAYTSNDAGLKFRWLLYDVIATEWMQISDWDVGNWNSWKPQKSGEYWFWVEAMTSSGEVKVMSYVYKVSDARISAFTASPDTPGWKNKKIQLNGTYWDYKDEVHSERMLLWDGKTWSELESKNGKATWIPDKIGEYLLCYEIYGVDGKLIEQTFKAYNIEIPYVNMNGIYVRDDGNKNYSMAVNYNSNDRNIQFRWLYYDLEKGTWNIICDWNSSNATNWKAPRVGNYWLHVEARLSNGIIKQETIAYGVSQYPPDLQQMLLYANMYSSPTSYIIMVNRHTHKVGVFQGWQNNWHNVKYWDCGDGAVNTPTVSGVFSVGSRGYYFDSGAARCYWWTQFYGNYLFHSVLYNKNGTLMDGRVGMGLSHGCVRLYIENAKWIYDSIPSGTTVVVY